MPCLAQSPAYIVKIRFGVLDTTCYPSCSHPSEWKQELYAEVYDSFGNLVPLSPAYYYNWGVDFCTGFGLLFGWAQGYGQNRITPDGNKVKSSPGCCDICTFQSYYVAVRVTIDDVTFRSETILIPNIEIPVEFDLRQNYPNPFNGVTHIRYSVIEVSDILVKVYGSTGKTVATLFQGNLLAGVYSAEWNAKNAATGIYFCQLVVKRANKKTITKTVKMIVQK